MSSVYFGTNRAPVWKDGGIVDFDGNFSPEGLQDLRFGIADVVDGRMVSLSTMEPSEDVLASHEVFARVKEKMANEGRDTLVIIHGYATHFKQAIEGAWRTKQAYGSANLNVVLFSWPSDGEHMPHDYGNDRHDAQASGLAFCRGLLKLADFLGEGDPCGRRVHLLAHSMGNYVLRHALQEMRKQIQGSLPRLFDTIFSMAADEDADALDSPEKWDRLPELCRELNIYINQYDHALQGSTLTKTHLDRMGNTGPDRPHDIPAKVNIVDVSNTDNLLTDLVGHGYYDEKPQVIEDVLSVLSGMKPVSIPGRSFNASKLRFELN